MTDIPISDVNTFDAARYKYLTGVVEKQLPKLSSIYQELRANAQEDITDTALIAGDVLSVILAFREAVE